MTDTYAHLQETIETAWDGRDSISTETQGEQREAVNEALALLDNGTLRVASPSENGWVVHQWLKKAVLLSFRLNENQIIS